MDDDNSDTDCSNIHLSSKLSDHYSLSGSILPFHQQKYTPLLEFIINYSERRKILRDVKLLDVGVGYGTFLKFCEEKGLNRLCGMDPFLKSIDIAKRYTSAELEIGRIEDLSWPYEDNYFDVITCLDVVEHLQSPEVFFENVKKYIANNGIIIIRTPNGKIPYLLRNLPFIGVRDDNPTHINVHGPKYWRRLAIKNEFKIIKDWSGEHLSHLKYLPYISKVTNFINIDHRKVPILNMFEQAYILILKLKE